MKDEETTVIEPEAPVDPLESSENEYELLWVTMPDGEAGITMLLFDQFGNICEEIEEAVVVRAVDRFSDIHQFQIEPETFNVPLLN